LTSPRPTPSCQHSRSCLSRDQCHKTFSVRNLQKFVKSFSVCLWQAYLSDAPLNGRLLALHTNIRLDCKGSRLPYTFVNYRCRKFYKIVPRSQLSSPPSSMDSATLRYQEHCNYLNADQIVADSGLFWHN